MINIARLKNPNRQKAYEIYIENRGNIKLTEIADMLNEKPTNIRSWKYNDKWADKIPKAGAPKGNKNAKGNRGGSGAPKGNVNSIQHGGYMSTDRILSKMQDILPKSMLNTIKALDGESSLDKLWRNIILLDAKISNAYKIIDVKNSKDHTIELKKTDGDFIENEILFAIEKETKADAAISRMKDSLTRMIKTYEELLHKNWDLATEEQKLRIELIKAQTNKLTGDNQEVEDTDDVESEIYGD
ncbi:MAG: phage terminase small subunit [Peptostreptococcaceae bacterium]